MMFVPRLVTHVICVCVFGQYTTGILFGTPATDYFADDWEPVFRIYAGSQWDSHADFLGPIRIAETSNTQSAQFRSWNLDRWHEIQPKKVKVEVYDDGYRVAVFEFDSAGQNLTSVFRQRNLKSTSFEDLPLAGSKFTGDDFSLDGDSDARHWVVSGRHVGDCRSDEGWFQVLDKPKPGRDRCVCGYENVDNYPTIMYAKGNRKTRWSDRDYNNEDDWEPVYRVYAGKDWDSHDDYMSQERGALHGDKDDSQFRSWKLDQWHNDKIQKVRVEIYDDGYEVAEFEFEGNMRNMTDFFSPRNLRKTTYADIPDGLSTMGFNGDDFSFDGDSDARHWVVSSRHVGDCRSDEGWFQVLDKPKPGRDRCVCGYENVDKYPTIMYAKGNRKTRWSDRANVGHADMMQVSISHVPYPSAPVARPAQPQQPMRIIYPQPSQPQMQPPYQQNPMFGFETKK